MMFMAVDFPEPDGPMIATNSLSAIARSTPASACTAAGPVPKTLVTFWRAMSGDLETESSIAPSPVDCRLVDDHCVVGL